MSQPKMGAMVRYCGHDGCFIADIFLIKGANVVVANGPVTPGNLLRPASAHEPTHWLNDFPEAGCWKPERGFFTVAEDQVVELDENGSPMRSKKAAAKKKGKK